MKSGLALIGVSILSLIASLGFGAPIWVNILGLVCGLVGVVLLNRSNRTRL